MNHAAQARTFEIPGDAWDRISRCPGQGGVEALGVAYREGTRCPGIAILINPTVRATMAVVLGTLASEEDPASTRVYVIDSRRTHLSLLLRELARENLAGQVTFYHGRPDEFFRDLPLLPGFICVDSQVGGLNLPGLCGRLPGGAGVLLLSDPDRPSVGISARECIRRGLMEEVYVTAGAVLYRTTNSSSGTGISLSTGAHNILQAKLHERYFLSTIDAAQDHTPVADLTEEIRRDFSFQISVNSGYGVWPYVNPDPVDLPWTMPGGKAWPKISIVTPSFNQGPYIEETILSVVNQGYPNVEHIIIDGGSTDGTRQVLEKYRNKIAHVVIEQDNGQSHAINKGMLLATGDILTWLNSDDRLAPGALASVALGLETSGADMVAGICRLYRNGQCERQHLTACADGPLPLHDLLDLDHGWNAGQFFYQPEVMFTRELWLRAGGHVNDWLHYSMDYELWLRFAEVGARLHVIGRPVAWFRLHDQQKTHVTERFQSELVVVRDGFLKTRGLTAAKAKTGLFRSALRVTFLNDHGPLFGAGIAHVRMARCVARAGHNVTLISIISGRRSDAEVPNYSVESVIDRIAATQPDLVIVGNLHNAAVEPLLLSFLCERFPTMVMMHDFWILTGRCAYTGDCAKYLTKCDETCPTADQYPALPPSEIVEAWRKKRSLLQSSQRPVLLTNSSWTDAFTRSALSSGSMAGGNGPTVERFQLSFPLDIFRPRDRRSCRDVFQLPQDSFIVLLAASLQDPRKGGLPFLEALERLQLPNLLVVTVGPIGDQPERSLKLLQLGYITDPHQVARLCSAADVVAVPSVAETFGQVCIESIACGTPVVGYPVTGIQEALTDGVTGLLATDTSPASLAAAVQQLYASPDLRRDLSRWGRLHVENNWSEFSAYRHLFLAMHAAGFADALNLRRNIGFIANDPGVPPIQNVWQNRAQWAPLRGVGWQEKAPEHGLDALWWIYGPSAMVEVFAKVSGPHVVLIAYRNFHDQQRLTLRCNGNVLGTFALPNTGFHNGRMLVLNTRLDVGANMLHFQSSKFNSQEHDSRQLAIMLTELLVEPSTRSARDELYGDARPEQVLASVWGETH